MVRFRLAKGRSYKGVLVSLKHTAKVTRIQRLRIVEAFKSAVFS